MSRVTLKQLIEQGFGQEPRDGSVTIFRNLRDGNLYRIYLSPPRMYTGSWLIAERMFYPNGVTKRIPESHQKDYVVVAHR
jgi:hypothetical protein